MFPFPYEEIDPSFYVDTTKTNLVVLEHDMFAEVNRARAKQGLPAYELSERLYMKAKNHSRQMALDQKLEPVNTKEFREARAGVNPTSFWAGISGNVARVRSIESPARIVDDWLKRKETRTALLSNRYNRSAVGISVDRKAMLYITLLSGEEVYQESNLMVLEKGVFDSINKMRERKGLRPLQLSEKLSKVARDHSREMALEQYFGHTDLKGMSPAERLRFNGVAGWRAVAENIADNKGQRDPVKAAVDGWIVSPSHAANILRPDFTHTGIGVAKALDETYYFTQMFTE